MKAKLRCLALAATLAVTAIGLSACGFDGVSSGRTNTVTRPESNSGNQNNTATPEHDHHFTVQMSGAPCDPNGYVVYSCDCGERFVVDNYLPHTYFDGKCIYCGRTSSFSLKGNVGSSSFGNMEGTPFGSIYVTVTDDDGNSYHTYSDEDGNYFFEDLPAGHYHVHFGSPDGDYDDVEFDVTLDQDTVRDVYFDYQQDSVLTGQVTVADKDLDYSNNVALSGVTVTLTKSSGTNELSVSMQTDTDGSYRFENLPAGSYIMQVSKDGYITIVQNINIARNVINVRNVILELIVDNPEVTTGSASGKVYDAARQGEVGISGLTLHVRDGINNFTGQVLTTLYTDDDGNYTLQNFPAGNYTVEIVDERHLDNEELRYNTGGFNIKVLAGESIPNQNGSTTNGQTTGQLRIKLEWGATPSDLDSHLTGPTADGDRFHVYYEKKSYGTFGSTGDVNLDRDDTDSYGPETTTVYVECEGTYRFSVHDYSNLSKTSNSYGIANSNAVVTVYFGDVPYYTFNAPYAEGTLWTVFEYDSTTREIKEINTMGYQASPGSVT